MPSVKCITWFEVRFRSYYYNMGRRQLAYFHFKDFYYRKIMFISILDMYVYQTNYSDLSIKKYETFNGCLGFTYIFYIFFLTLAWFICNAKIPQTMLIFNIIFSIARLILVLQIQHSLILVSQINKDITSMFIEVYVFSYYC